MEKEKQLEPKLLRRELFRVKCPRRIVAGDPYYFETEPPERLKKLVVDYIPPRSYEARLVLSQYEMHDFGVYQTNAVQIYLAPGKDVDVYAAEKMYADQRIEQKEIGVDTASYIMEIDDRWKEFHTGADGCWGNTFTYFHTRNGRKQVDGKMIMFTMPEEVSFEEMKRIMDTLFAGLQPVRSCEKQKSVRKQHQQER